MMGSASVPAGDDLFSSRLAMLGDTLAPAARRVVHYIDQNRAAALASSAVELASRTGTSDATVIRAVQALGFAGLGDVKQALVASIEGMSTLARDLARTLAEIDGKSDRAVDMVFDAHDEALAELRTPASRATILAAVSALHLSERIAVFGIGPSAALAGYATVQLARAGRRSMALNATGIMLADQLLDLRTGDALVVLAYGRAYREVITVLGEAQRLHLPTVLITDTLEARLARMADVVLATRRGRADRVALHGATLVVLEALIMGLAAANRPRAMTALERLNDLRVSVSGQQNDVG